MKTHIMIFLVVACGILIGCATGPEFNVGVNSFKRPDVPFLQTYVVVPSEEDKSINDLEFIEYSSHVDRALGRRGMKRTYVFDEADIAIFLSYGIGDPKDNRYSFSLPTWGQTGVASSYSSGTVRVTGQTATYSGTTNYVPSYGVTGYQNIQGSYTTYSRHASLTAYDLRRFRQSQEEMVLWDTRIISNGTSSDLRQVFPIMIAAAIDYIGSNTGKMIQVSLKEGDRRVRYVRGEIEMD